MTTRDANGIDPAGPSGRLLHKGDLAHNPAPQAIATDTKNDRIFVLQVESTTDKRLGHLILNRFDRTTGKRLDHMRLIGFGHGLSLGAEADGTDTYLWTECGPLHIVDADDPARAFAVGTTATRFKYDPVNTPVLDAETAVLPRFTPAVGNTATGPSYDPTVAAPTVTVMHIEGEERHFTRYDGASAKAGTWNRSGERVTLPRTQPHATVAPSLPQTPALAKNLSFQGFQTIGDVLYVYQWAKFAVGTNPGHTLLRRFSWTTGLPIDAEPVLVTAAPGLVHREPEGLSAEIDPATGKRRLLFGFSNTIPGEKYERDVTICWFPAEEPVEGVQVLGDWEELALAGGLTAAGEAPRVRLVAVADTTYLQFRGSFSVSPGATKEFRLATLPHRLRPTVPFRHNAPRNNNSGRAICSIETTVTGELWVYGATADNAITWVDLNSVSGAWR
ncbi:hypothetical protein [Streptomyces omiyaensis]|uniref:hypothetical protein n=1 Tax=Streptomyces omiyaensis TaxID=68247 RepID=UPI0036F4CBEF